MQKALFQSPFRYIPFSNPYWQLLAALLKHTQNRQHLPMSTTLAELAELPAIDPTPPPSRTPIPSEEAKAAAEIGRKKDRKNGQRTKYETPSKFANKPPNPLYSFDSGLRRVNPYYFTYNTFCKERWRGMTLVDIFLSEFRDRPAEYYKRAIAAGTVSVCSTQKNGRKAIPRSGLDAVVNNGDMISHTTHRHEPPVTDKPIGIVYEDDNIIAISKPAGVPVHPTGRYNYNSVTEIMRHDRPGFNPMPCNRLDRLTSGLMFIAKTRQAAEDFMNQLQTKSIKKQYVARVKGEFPEGDVVCEEPIRLISPKLGLNMVKADGKHAKTLFRRLKYNPEGNYSIVECHPFTGRTHQIRVHLQFLGHPISNDPIYCNRRVWGEKLGRGGEENDEDIITRLNRMGKEEVAEAEEYHSEIRKDYEERKAEKMNGLLCEVCETPLYSDPGPHELGIYLHAKRYECEEAGWAYETKLPDWAEEAAPPGAGVEGTGATEVKVDETVEA